MPRQGFGSLSDVPLPKNIGRYEVVRLIGEGAMGRVLLAHDPVLGRDVAVKLVRDDLKIPADVREGLVIRMRHEARAAARVTHPNLVTLHDMGEDDKLGLYLVFEYVEGPTLKSRLLEGPLAPRQAARLARELGAALAVAHRAGIVHRDIKPDNVILSSTGGKIADFGIARIPDSTLTHQGGLLGTPAYSAPETFKAGKFSPESDQFSLAASLYEAISGRRAYPGDDAAVVASKITNETPERFTHYMRLPAAVDDVLLRGMAKNPSERWDSCETFGEAFAVSLGDAASRASDASLETATGSAAVTQTQPPTIPPLRGELPSERKTGQVVLGAAALVVTAALLLRAALRSTENTGADETTSPAAASASASSVPSTSARPRPTAPPVPRPPRSSSSGNPPHPKASADPSASPAAGSANPAALADAGAKTAPSTAPSSAPSAAPDAGP